MNKLVLFSVLFLAALFSFASAESELFKPYACGSGTCYAMQVNVIAENEYVYAVYNGTGNNTLRIIYYDEGKSQSINATNVFLARDLGLGCPNPVERNERFLWAEKYGNDVYLVYPSNITNYVFVKYELSTNISTVLGNFPVVTCVGYAGYGGFGRGLAVNWDFANNRVILWYIFSSSGSPGYLKFPFLKSISTTDGSELFSSDDPTVIGTWSNLSATSTRYLNTTNTSIFTRVYKQSEYCDLKNYTITNCTTIYNPPVATKYNLQYFEQSGQPSVLQSNDLNGQIDVYSIGENGQNVKRLTATAKHELISDVWINYNGTAFVTYYNTSSLFNYSSVFFDTFCTTDLTPQWNTVCGTAAYSAGTAPRSLALKVWDDAECNTWFSGTDECKKWDAQAVDWINVEYLIDGKIALPSSEYANNYTEQNFIKANATCEIAGTPDITLNWSGNGSLWANEWGYPINAFSAPFCLVGCAAYLGEYRLINVSCSSDLDDSTISTLFYAENTKQNNTLFVVAAGTGGTYDSTVYQSESPIEFRSIQRFEPSLDDQTNYIDLTFAGINGLTMTSLGEAGGNWYWKYEYPITPFNPLSAGWYKYQINSLRTISGLRKPSVARRSAFLVTDRCEGSYDYSTITDIVLHDGLGNEGINGTIGKFCEKQNLHLTLKYTVPNSRYGCPEGNCYIDNWAYGATCSVAIKKQLTNAVIVSNRSIFEGIGAPYFSFMPLINLGKYENGSWITAGNYYADIYCYNQNDRYCIAGAKAIRSPINISVCDGCAGTSLSCGTEITPGSACVECPLTTTTCEDGQNYSVRQDCYSQQCVNYTAYSDVCEARQIYSIDLFPKGKEYPCQNKQEIAFNTIFKIRDRNLDANELTSVNCVLSITPADQFIPFYETDWYPMNYDASTGYYTLSGSSGLFDGLDCEKGYYARAECWAAEFTHNKIDTTDFTLGGWSSCTDGTAQFDCSEDQPLWCDTNYQLINQSILCGCPTGMKVNETDNTCSGTAFDPDYIFGLGWLNFGTVLLLIFALPFIFALLWFFQKAKEGNR